MYLLVPAYPGSPGQKAVKRLCVCVYRKTCVIGHSQLRTGGFCRGEVLLPIWAHMPLLMAARAFLLGRRH